MHNYAIIWSDSGISDRNFVKSRLERTLCIDDSSRNRDNFVSDGLQQVSLAENKN